jgi:hypothetical protein
VNIDIDRRVSAHVAGAADMPLSRCLDRALKDTPSHRAPRARVLRPRLQAANDASSPPMMSMLHSFALFLVLAPASSVLSPEAAEYNAKAMRFYDAGQLAPAVDEFYAAYQSMPDARRDLAGREQLVGSMRSTLLDLHDQTGEAAPICRLQSILQEHADALAAAFPKRPGQARDPQRPRASRGGDAATRRVRPRRLQATTTTCNRGSPSPRALGASAAHFTGHGTPAGGRCDPATPAQDRWRRHTRPQRRSTGRDDLRDCHRGQPARASRRHQRQAGRLPPHAGRVQRSTNIPRARARRPPHRHRHRRRRGRDGCARNNAARARPSLRPNQSAGPRRPGGRPRVAA